jgi:signal transduction histidine kinase
MDKLCWALLPMKILIIDDDDGIRTSLQDLLEINGHTVCAAAGGREGVRLAADRPELIFCDVDMPGMDGYETITAIQQLPPCRDVPFIFLTGRTDREDQRRGMTLGADDYITKPFRTRDILDAIAARVRRQSPLRERIQQLVDERQQEATADWSHELMTPLNAVFGGLDLIEGEADTIKPDELKELLAIIRAGAERQQRLSRKLIRFFGLERRQTTPPSRPPSCRAESAVAAGAMRAAQEAKRPDDLRVDCEPGGVALAEELLADAVAELVENACHFSAQGQSVEVSGRCTGQTYRIEVVDGGPGMAPAQRASVGAFVQFDRSRREQQGLGLGLAIVRATAALAGGRLSLQDGPGGRGLSAVLELPLA